MRIRWTTLAADDLTHICDYIEEHDGPNAARRVAIAIVDGRESLSRFPRRGRLGRKAGTRELVFTALPYLAIYRVQAEIVEINRILHGAQKWP
jgi:plasmid stabilization system protein ParE